MFEWNLDKGLLKHTEVVYVFIAVTFFFISFKQRSAKLAPQKEYFLNYNTKLDINIHFTQFGPSSYKITQFLALV